MAAYDGIEAQVRNILGDTNDDSWDAQVIEYSIHMAMDRYSTVVERVITQCIQLTQAGVWAQPLTNWTGDPLCEVVYVHWPAHSTIPTTTDENKVLDYFYYFHGSKPGASIIHTCYLDLKVDGSTLPAASDYIMVTGTCKHRIEGMEYEYYGGGDSSTYTTIPLAHRHIISLGAAAYCLRSHEVNRAVKAGAVPVGFESAYHVGIMADMAERFMRDFEAELYLLAQKKLDRPIWGDPERRRLQRLADIGSTVPRPKSR